MMKEGVWRDLASIAGGMPPQRDEEETSGTGSGMGSAFGKLLGGKLMGNKSNDAPTIVDAPPTPDDALDDPNEMQRRRQTTA